MAVGGRRSHAPQPTADRTEKINTKERRKAIRSAIAATAVSELVSARGHVFSCELPVVVENALASLNKTAEMKKFLESAGLWSDIERAKLGLNTRAGKGKFRGRRYKGRKSILVIAGQDQGISKASRNLPGVDFATIERLNAELLAPGTKAGRLTIWTESSLQKLSEISGKE